MTTVPETAVAGALVAGGVMLAMVMFTAGHYSLWPQPNLRQTTTLTCPNGNVLSILPRLCHPVPLGPVDIRLDNRDAVTIPIGETGNLQVISGGITIDDGLPFLLRKLLALPPTTTSRPSSQIPFYSFGRSDALGHSLRHNLHLWRRHRRD